MPPTFLPVLRREVAAVAAAEQKALGSVAFSTYYADLAAHNIHNRARDWPIERAVTEGYDRVIWVFKSVNTIGSDSARLPFRLREGMDDDDPVVDDHPLYRVLNKKANPVETGQVFRKRLTAQVLLSKRGAFVEVTKSNGGSVKRLDLLPPDRTEPIPAEDGSIDHYRLTRRDGTIRNLEPDVVRWFRDPHPIDPYMGVTPLESAGMSVELDHFARLYNVTFMQNDGRPGGVLAVRNAGPAGTAGGDISEPKMNRLESRFGKGPYEAGKLSVISGELSYVDLATRPRDMQYGATARNAKIEILSAFGVPESVLGYSAERTYDNADAELYTYWTRTLPAHHEIILTGLDEDSDDNLYGFFDTSKVEVLERAARARREEARTEVEKGLRSIHSYVVLAGYGDEVEETAHTRALYVPTGKTPIPSREEDAEALGLATPTDEPVGGPDGAAPPPPGAAPGGPTEPDTGPPAPPQPPAPNPAAPNPGLTAGRGAAAAALAALAGKAGGTPPKVVIRVERKAPTPLESEPDLAAADELETVVAAVLASLAERWVERAIARLSSPKQRKHTRHWTPENDRDTRIGTKALDTARAVDEDTWRVEAEAAVGPLVTAAAVAAAADLLDVFEFNPPPGVSREDAAADAAAVVLTEVLTLVGRSATEQAMRLAAQVNDADQEGEAFDVIVAGMRKTLQTRMSSWAEGLATQVATATVNGGRDGAAREVSRDDQAVIDRTWFSRRDTKVRPTHQPRTGADGQTRGLDEPFIVGDTLLRFPGDPLAPFRESAGCRCFLRYRVRKTGRWTANPFALKALPRDADSDGFIYDGTPRQRLAPVARYPHPPSGLGAVRRRIVVRPTAPPPPPPRAPEPASPVHIPRTLQATAAHVARVIGGGDTLASRPPATRDLLRRGGDPDGQDLLAPRRRPSLADRLVTAAADYDRAVDDTDPGALLDALSRLLEVVEEVRDTYPGLDDDTMHALDALTSPSVRIPPRAVGVKRAPRDGDGDGLVDDGTPTERPAPDVPEDMAAVREVLGDLIDRNRVRLDRNRYGDIRLRAVHVGSMLSTGNAMATARQRLAKAGYRTIGDSIDGYVIHPPVQPGRLGHRMATTRGRRGRVYRQSGVWNLIGHDGAVRGQVERQRPMVDGRAVLDRWEYRVNLRGFPDNDRVYRNLHAAVAAAERAMEAWGVKAVAREPQDGDDDGFVYDGTPRQRPARPRLSAAEQAADYSRNLDYRRGHKAVREAMAPHAGDRDVLEQSVRDMEARLAGAEFNSREYMLTAGALDALRELHAALPSDAKPVYDEGVNLAATPTVAVPPVVYHVAPATVGASITEHGIDRTRGESPWRDASVEFRSFPPGNYVFTTREDAEKYVWPGVETEVWEVTTEGLNLQPDPMGTPGGMVSYDPIPPSAVRRATAPESTRHPNFGKRIGEPRKQYNAISKGTDIIETIGGPDGEPHYRVLYRVEKTDGVWGVHPPTSQSPAIHTATSKAKAEKWAMNRANGTHDWVRSEYGYLSDDEAWFLERGAPMYGGQGTAWLVWQRVPEERIGRESRFVYDTNDGSVLRSQPDGEPQPPEYTGPLYAHVADAGSLAEAKLATENIAKREAERSEAT